MPILALAFLAALVTFLAALIGVPILAASRESRLDYRRTLAEGEQARAIITAIRPDSRGGATVLFSFRPAASTADVVVAQKTSLAATDVAGLAVGSGIDIHYRAKTPTAAFAVGLIAADRLKVRPGIRSTAAGAPALYFISFTIPGRSAYSPGPITNGLRWRGAADLTIGNDSVRIVAREWRAFRFPKPVDVTFALQTIANVEVLGNTVSLEILESDRPARALKFWTVNPEAAAELASRLPSTKTEAFAPQMAEAAEFEARARALSPAIPVTATLIALNCLVFVATLVAGAGLFAVNPAVLVRWGSDYTPLTMGGQWWRLETSTFLHFGVLHVGLNMYALASNGPLAERLFGSARYLLIYLAAGLAGSAASLWWHPVVNGAGASGAIFGVFGALLAFFLRQPGGVPASVIKRHRASVAIFIFYNLLNGARVAGIDNSAHIGGLAAGFVLGLLLTRSLDGGRSPSSERIGTIGVAVGALIATIAAYAHSPIRPPLTTFWDVRLGETRAEVVRDKGTPQRVTEGVSIYESAGHASNGVVEIRYTKANTSESDTISFIAYEGATEDAPSDLPRLIDRSRRDLVAQFGPPYSEQPGGAGTSFLAFTNGLWAALSHDKVTAYGLQDGVGH
jgi:membrane associated rhomboid family serine protease